MRNLVCACVVGLVALSGGCGKEQPPTAGGKPVGYWVEALGAPDSRARRKAAFKLGNAGASEPAVVPALIGALKDRDAGVRGEAVLALLKIGPAAQEAVPALREARKDRDARVRAYANKALENVQSDQ